MSFEQQQLESEGMNYVQEELTENALKIRLEVAPIYERIEMYLSGQEYQVKNGRIIKTQNGDAKANAIGVRAIMNVVMSYINQAVVQGNLRQEDVSMLMMDFRRNMGSLLAWRTQYYAIKRSERKQIIDFLEPMVFMFISRTKDNKERDSYGMRTIERGRDTQMISQKRGFFR